MSSSFLQRRLDQMVKAADRWADRTPIRDAKRAASARGDFLKADSTAHMTAHLNHLLAKTRAVLDAAGVAPAEAGLSNLPTTKLSEDDLDNELVQEVIKGTSNFLSVEFFERGLVAGRAVGRISLRSGGPDAFAGTGFLIGPGVLMTNHHVLHSAALAGDCVLEMNHELNSFGPARSLETFVLKPDQIFLNDKTLDVAVVGVAEQSNTGTPLASFGWLRLDPRLGKIAVNEISGWVNIIQHPKGGLKEVVIRDNRLLDLRTEFDEQGRDFAPFIHYESDTEHGSSGAPVFNDGWELVALHHVGVPNRNAEKRILRKDGQPWVKGRDPENTIDWLGNEGVRVSVIADWLSGKGKLIAGPPPRPDWAAVVGLATRLA